MFTRPIPSSSERAEDGLSDATGTVLSGTTPYVNSSRAREETVNVRFNCPLTYEVEFSLVVVGMVSLVVEGLELVVQVRQIQDQSSSSHIYLGSSFS